jgi:uncharacterized protein
MIVNVSQLLKEPVGSSKTIEVDEQIGQGHSHVINIAGSVTLTRINKGIVARGNMASLVKGTCSRCLEPINQTIKFDLEEEFLPKIDIHSGLPADVEDDTFTIDSRHNIDLQEALYQNALSSMPMKTLCRSSCKGICSVCGANLNVKPCNCSK